MNMQSMITKSLWNVEKQSHLIMGATIFGPIGGPGFTVQLLVEVRTSVDSVGFTYFSPVCVISFQCDFYCILLPTCLILN